MAGVKGRSGRHTIEEQLNNVKVLQELFHKKHKLKKLEQTISSGKYSGNDMFAFKVLSGDKDLIKTLVQKLFPDSYIADINARAEFDGISITEPKAPIKSGDSKDV